jgi:hypothetical protein
MVSPGVFSFRAPEISRADGVGNAGSEGRVF